MSLFKRGNIWWVGYTAPSGRRVRRSTGTADRQQAQEYHDRLKAELWRVHRLKERPRRRWQEAVVKWLKETDHKRTHEKDKEVFRWLDRYLGGKWLDEIDREIVDAIAEAKADETSKATANRYLALLRAVLRRAAFDWEWLDRIPRVRLFQVSKRRVRWITREQFEALCLELPAHQAAMARFAVATGLRQRNVCRLQWSQVDLDRRVAWIHPDQAKAGRAIAVALNAEAVEVLRGQAGQHERYVFVFNGEAVWQVNTKAWRRAVRAVGLEDFRWHDLRHTWASWHVQAGTPLNVLQEMGGWESAEMVRRYAHLSAEHLLTHAERIAPHVTNAAQGAR